MIHSGLPSPSDITCACLSGPPGGRTPSLRGLGSWSPCPSQARLAALVHLPSQLRDVGSSKRHPSGSFGCHSYSSLPVVTSPDIKVNCSCQDGGSLFCLTFSGEEGAWSAQAAATVHSSKGLLLCHFFPPPQISPARLYGHMADCTTPWTCCRAISCSRLHSKLTAFHDTCYMGYSRTLQNHKGSTRHWTSSFMIGCN